jgi:hypothetical protein
MRIALLFLTALSTALSQSVSFPGPGMPASSGGGGTFLHHRTFTIDHTQVGGSTLTNFPVLVSLTLGTGKIQNATCDDVILTSDSGATAKLAWDPEAGICNSTTGTFAAWVLIPSISSTVDTVFYVFYDNVAISSPQNTGSFSPAKVWSTPGYLGVFHLPNGSILTANDSTSNGFNGTLGPTTHAPSGTTGEIDGAGLFASGSSQYFTIPTTMSPLNTKTLSFWVKWTTHSGIQSVIGLDGTSGTADGFGVFLDGGVLVATAMTSNSSGQQAITSFSDAVWYYVVVEKTTGQINKLYINGGDVTTANLTDHLGMSFGNNVVGIANDLSSFPLNAAIDELRLFNGTLPPGWITAEYNNQTSSAFLTVGGEI